MIFMNSLIPPTYGQRASRVVDELFFDESVNAPFVAELLAHGDRYARPLPDRLIRKRPLAADEVLAKVGMQWLEHRGQVDGVRRIELRMEVDGPSAVTSTFVQQDTIVIHLPDEFEPVNFSLPRVIRSITVGAKTGPQAGACRIFERASAPSRALPPIFIRRNCRGQIVLQPRSSSGMTETRSGFSGCRRIHAHPPHAINPL